jgi:hypothetical protein
VPGLLGAEHHQADMRIDQGRDGRAALVCCTDILPNELADLLRGTYAAMFDELVDAVHDHELMTANAAADNLGAAGLRFEREGAIGWCIIDRPEARNAFTPAMYFGIKRAVHHVNSDPELAAMIITGTGDVFSAGGDLGGRTSDGDEPVPDVGHEVLPWACDNGDWVLLPSVFTADAELDYSLTASPAGGRDEVCAWLEESLSQVGMIQHGVSNFQIDVSGDRAEGRAMFFTSVRIPGHDGVMLTGGYYRLRMQQLMPAGP